MEVKQSYLSGVCTVAAPASKFRREGKGEARENFRGAKMEKLHMKKLLFGCFCAEIVKFGLISHL